MYTLIAGVIATLTAPIPGTSLLLTALEIFMIVHFAKVHDFKLGIKEIGTSTALLWGTSTVLRNTAVEILNYFPVIGWAAEVIVAVLFVLFLGILVNFYFKKDDRHKHS